MTDEKDTRRALARGAGVNFIGIVAKSLQPLLYILITRLYGPAVFGVYLLANALLEMVITLLISGFQDGVLLFASRHVRERSEHGIMYRAMANAVLVIALLTAIAWALMFTVGEALLSARFEQPGLAGAVKLMILALPLVALSQMIVAASKSLMIMKYDVILLSFLKPLLLLLLAVGFYSIDGSVVGLASAYLVANLIVACAALWVFGRHFSYRLLWQSLRRPAIDWELVKFAIPQNLNLTLTRLMSDIGILFLGAYGVSAAKIAFYGTAAEIMRNLRQIRLVFSTAFTPVVARLYKEKRVGELELHYADLTRWIVMLAVPMGLLILAFRGQLLSLFHPSYLEHDSGFMLILAAHALVACSLGLASNIIVMTGHSSWNLYKSIGTATLAVLLNMALIPRLGLIGAALATLLTTSASIAVSLLLCHALLKVRLRVGRVAKPALAGVIAFAAFAAIAMVPLESSLARSLSLSLGSIAAFAATMALLGIDAREKEIIQDARAGLASLRGRMRPGRAPSPKSEVAVRTDEAPAPAGVGEPEAEGGRRDAG